jgi:hypothetical protein
MALTNSNILSSINKTPYFWFKNLKDFDFLGPQINIIWSQPTFDFEGVNRRRNQRSVTLRSLRTTPLYQLSSHYNHTRRTLLLHNSKQFSVLAIKLYCIERHN